MAAVSLSFLLAALRFQGIWQCPDATAVEAQLVELHMVATGDHRVELVTEEDSEELLLTDESGAILGRRVVPSDRNCARRAHVIAVLVASWESELALRTPALPAVAPIPVTTPTIGSSAQPPVTAVVQPAVPTAAAPALSTASTAAPAQPSPTKPAAESTAVAPVQQEPASSAEWRIGLGPFGAVADYESALGGVVFASLKPPASRWGGHLKAFAATARSFTLGPGTVSWERFGGSAGGSFGLTLEPLVVEVELDAALAFLRAQGQGFRLNSAPSAIDPGISLGVLASWRGFAVEPWLGTWVFAWPIAQYAQVGATTLSRAIPQVDLVLGIGVALHLR
jgi:hypothetical protein